MTTTTGNSDGSSQNPGLLPTSSVNVNDASKAPKGAGKFAAGGDMYSSMLIGHHDKEYYENWNRERQEAIARGEDPNAKFIALAKQREQEGYQGKIRRFFGRLRGKKAGKQEPIGANDETRQTEGEGSDGVIR